jgi:L-malate glycosyltransferase
MRFDLKVAFLAPGISWHTIRWYNALKESIDIRIFTLHPGSSNCIGKQSIIKSQFPSKLKYLFSVSALKSKIDKFKPDLVHSHYATGYGHMGARLDFHPLVISVWGSDIFSFPRRTIFHKMFLNAILKKADAICATSQILKDETAQQYPDYLSKLNVIPFGIDLSLFSTLDQNQTNDEIVIGTARLLGKNYRIDLLMKEFDRIAAYNNKIRLMIAGDGPEKESLLLLKGSLASNDRIEFVGMIDNNKLPDFLHKLDIVVVPSKLESFCVLAVEASACGIPVVSFNVGGIPEVIENEISGLLVPENNFEALGRALSDLISDEEKRRNLGKAGRSIAEKKFNIIDSSRMMIELYERLLSEK